MSAFPDIFISADCPPDKISFVVPRKYEVVVLPSGEKRKAWLESEEEWARKCGMITGLKT